MRNLPSWVALAAMFVLGVLATLIVAQVPKLFFKVSAEDLLTQMNDAQGSGGYAATFTTAEAPRWQVGPGHRVERLSLDDGKAAVARLTSTVVLDPKTWSWSTQGLSTVFPVEFNNRTGGQTIEIGIVARASASNPSSTLSAVYATQQAGNSGWRDLPLSPEFEMKTFTFKVPPAPAGGYTKQPILVLNSDRQGTGRAIEILGIYIKPTASTDTGQQGQ